jgi:hypothetical protein
LSRPRLLSVLLAVALELSTQVAVLAQPAAAAAPEHTSGYTHLTCVSTTECWAIDETAPVAGLLHLVAGRWSPVALPVPPEPAGQQVATALNGLACPSARDCWAVGSETGRTTTEAVSHTLAAHWNGIGWRLVTVPAVSGRYSPGLSAVSCLSSANCWVLGESGDVASDWHWNGRSWTARPIGAAADGFIGGFQLTCSVSGCWTVGTRAVTISTSDGPRSGDSYETLLLRHGTWTAFALPAQLTGLSGHPYIACATASSCWVVGSYSVRVGLGSLANDVIHWSGHRWTWMAVPNPGGTGSVLFDTALIARSNALTSVSCVAAHDCWAVGGYLKIFPTGGARPVVRSEILHWNGKGWSVVASPKPVSGESNILDGVSCFGTTCRVLGRAAVSDGQAVVPIAAHWNGKSWGP